MKIPNIQIIITAILKPISNSVLHIFNLEELSFGQVTIFIIWMRYKPSALLSFAKLMLQFLKFFLIPNLLSIQTALTIVISIY